MTFLQQVWGLVSRNPGWTYSFECVARDPLATPPELRIRITYICKCAAQERIYVEQTVSYFLFEANFPQDHEAAFFHHLERVMKKEIEEHEGPGPPRRAKGRLPK